MVLALGDKYERVALNGNFEASLSSGELPPHRSLSGAGLAQGLQMKWQQSSKNSRLSRFHF